MNGFEAILDDALASPETFSALRARARDDDADELVRKELLEIEEALDEIGERVDDLLDEQPLSIDLHNTALQLAYLRGDEARFELHRRVLDAIADAVQASGDGISAATAYRPLHESEMYLLINRLELEVAGHRELEDDGRTYDIIEGRDAEGNLRAVYFERA
jgi:hypothetical protein